MPPIYDTEQRPALKPGFNTSFDRASGQIFTEVTCQGTPMTASWTRRVSGKTRKFRKHREPEGPSSLFDTCIRKTLCNYANITTESLGTVPWAVAKHLWHKIVFHQLDSFQIWKAFASAYPMEGHKSLKSKVKRVSKPVVSLDSYLRPLASPLSQWITFLTLTDLICTRAELVQISSLNNLGVLTIGKGVKAPDVGLEDIIIRAWSRAAAEAGAFSSLRVFILDSQPKVTAEVFTHLDQFPSLGLFLVQDSIKEIDLECFQDPQSHWKCLEGSWLRNATKGLNRYNRNHKWTLVYNSCFRDDGTFDIERIVPNEKTEPYSAQDPPVIDFRIGTTVPMIPEQGREPMTFYRTSHQNLGTDKTVVPKRPLDWSSRQTSDIRKKPRLRASKQQPMDRLSINPG